MMKLILRLIKNLRKNRVLDCSDINQEIVVVSTFIKEHLSEQKFMNA